MDPTACWNEMLDALRDGDRETARDRANDLYDWLGRGGFAPVTKSDMRRVDFEWIARGVVQACGGRKKAV